ncbi:hypothetical protein Tco_1449973 [Tanacetum coccineum]
MYPPPHLSQPQISHLFVPPSQQYQSHQTSSVPLIAYNLPQASTQPLTEFPQMDSGLAILVFNQGDDAIACLSKAMYLFTVVASLRFPSTNNQLRTSSNLRNQATIQDGRVTVQQVQGRKGQSYAGNSYKGNATSSGVNNAGGHAKTEDLDAYDSNCDDVSMQKAFRWLSFQLWVSDDILESQNVVILVIDDEETLILEEVSRSKMLAKQNNPISKEKKINTTPVNYVELNRLFEDFGKRFVPQQELFAEQAFWLQTSNPNTNQCDISPVKIEAPRELPKTLKDIFNVFDKDLLNEVTEVQTIFNQMEAVVQQYVMICVMNSTAVFNDSVNLEMKKSESCNKCLDLEAELVKKKNMVERDVHTKLSSSFTKLEIHCISLELDIQLNQQIFPKDKSYNNQNALEILEYFENNDLKAQLQAKDTIICKLKEHIKSIREYNKEEKVKQEMDEIETINIELEHMNSKSMENADLKGKIQEKVLVTTALQNELRRSKGKNVLKKATTITNATTIAPGMFKLDLDPLAPRLLKNRDAHINYLKYTQEQADILQGIVEQAKAKQPLDNALDFACSSKKAKIVESRIANNSEPNHFWGSNATDVPSSSYLVNDSKFLRTVRFRNDQIAKIMGYGDYQLGNVTISRVYYVEGLGHNLFSFGHICDSDLEVAFQKNTFFIQNLDGVDLLSGSRDTNLYIISLDDMLKTYPICLLSKASKTKSWLWHRREDLGKLNAKADIGIFVGYAPAKKAFRIYNRRTRKIMEAIYVTFDELTAMASK